MTGTPFFETGSQENVCVIMAPASVGSRRHMVLLSQGSALEVGHQVCGRSEAYRVMFRKCVVCPGPLPGVVLAMADPFKLAAGVHVVLVPLPQRGPSAWMQDVTMPVVTPTLTEALDAARALGCLALVGEILRVAQAEVPDTAWVSSDQGRLTFPPWSLADAGNPTTTR